MVITSWLSALSSKMFGKKLPPRMRKEPSKQGPQASATSEVLEERTLMTVNPVIDIYTEGVDEDHVFSVNAPGVLANDPLGVGARSTIQVTNTAVGTALLNSDGSFTYDPGASLQSLAAGEFSIQEFTYKVSDAGDFSVGPTEIVRLYVKGLNDATTATGTTQSLGYTEDNGSVSLGAIEVDDVDHNEVITATLTLSDGNAGSLSAPGATFNEGVLSITGTKTDVNAALAAVQFTPSSNYDKDFTINVNIQDGGEDGVEPVTGTITMTVTPVPDAPVASDGSFTINEDALPYSGTLIANDVDTNPAPSFTFVLTGTSATKGMVVITDDATGAFTYTVNDDEFGTDTFQFEVTDNDTLTSEIKTVTVTINSVNDIPAFTKGADETVEEDSGVAGAHTVNGWATDISKGPSNESDQTLQFNVSSDNTSLFSVQPAIDASGNLTYTLAANAYGEAIITVTLSDNGGTANSGVDTSAPQTFNITVTPINDIPTFTVGEDQTSNEDAGEQSVTGFITVFSAGPNESSQQVDFVVTNDSNPLFEEQPAIDETGKLTYKAAANQYGTATVTVYIHDDGGTANSGVDSSVTQTFTIVINSVNDTPSFTKGADQTVVEDTDLHTIAGWATDISTGPSDESGQEVTFQVSADNTSLFSVQPAIDADGQLTYTLAANAFGTAIVTVTLSDNGGTANGGVDTSAPQTFNITVTPINDIPTFTVGEDQTSNEDAGEQSVTGFITVFSAGPNESSQQVDFVVTNDNNPLFEEQPAIDATGKLTYKAAANQHGTATVTVYIHDDGGTAIGGVDTSLSQTFTIDIAAVNDAPSFTKGADETVDEDSGLLHTVNGWATNISEGPSDESGQDVIFQVSADNTSLFTVQPAIDSNGNLTYTLAANAFGTAVVTVTLSDDGGTANGGDDTSDAQTFNITVTGINDTPTFTKGADETVYEDDLTHSVADWATGISAGPGESLQDLTFNVTDNTNPGLFSVAPAISSDGTLTYTLAENANGTAMITITLSDNGGTVNGGVDTSSSQTFAINVIGVNDAPSFTKGEDEEVLEDSGPLHTVPNWATGISKGPTSDEDSQSVLFNVSNDNNDLFSVQPAIAANGSLTYTLAPNAFGTATVTVTLSDDGGTSDGGANTSAPQTFEINVIRVNDAPSFTVGPDQFVAEDSQSCTHNLITNGGFEGDLSGWTTVGMDLGNDEDPPSNNFYLQTGTENPLASGPEETFVVSAPPEGNNAAMADQTGPGASLIYQDFVVPSDIVSATISIQLYINNHDIDFTEPLPLEVEGDGEDYELANQQARIEILKSTASIDSTDPEDILLTLFQTVPGVAPEFGYSTLTADLTAFLQAHPGETLRLRIATFNTEFYFQVGVDDIQLNVTTPAEHTVSNWATDISAGPGEDQDVTFEVTNDNNALFSVQPAVSPTGELTYTLAPNVHGSATVTVILHDDGGTSNSGVNVSAPQMFTINVASVNDAPVFDTPLYTQALEDTGAHTVPGFATGIAPGPDTATDESGQHLTFVVTNDNNDMFTVQPSIDPDTGDLTYTLAPNAHGNVTVTATLYDDGGSSLGGIDHSTRLFSIVVENVNDVPSFTLPGLPDQTVLEDAGTQTVVGFATSISAGANEAEQSLWFDISTSDDSMFEEYPHIDPTTGTLTYKTAEHANGDVTITVRLVDNGGTRHGGVDESAPQTFTIHITPVNDAPVAIDRLGIAVNEDGSRDLDVLSTTIDPDGDPLQIAIVTPPEHGEAWVDDNETPNDLTDDFIVYEPDPDYNGTDTFTYKVTDPDDESSTATVTMNVIANNDPPTFTVGGNQTVDEDSTEQTVLNFISTFSPGPADESGQTVDFIVENDNNSLFSAQPTIDANGTLTYTPAANQYGTAIVTVRAHDDGGDDDTSAPQTFTITITAINDIPSFTVGGPQLSLEDAGPQTVNDFISDISSGTNESQTVDFIVTNDNNELFSVQPTIDADGNLTYTAAENMFGTAVVTVQIHDDGGTASGGVDTSTTQTFNIVIAAVNDEPSFTVGPDQTVSEDSGAQTVEDFATSISAGPSNESDQLVDFVVTNDNNSLFSVQPSISADGTLTYTPAENQFGSAVVTVYIHDDGGTDDGGDDISSLQTFLITVTAVNDVPSFTIGDNQTSAEDGGAQTVEDFITVFSPGPSNESEQTIDFIVTNDNNALFSVQPSISADGTLTYTAAAHQNGTATVTVQIHDNGGGTDTSTTQTFTITITEVFDAPVIDDANFNVAENSPVGTEVGTIVSTDPDVGDTATFTITSGNDAGTFAINPTTGVITVANNAELDFETHPTLQIVVQVTDGHALIDTCVVIISVTNVAEPTTLDLPSAPNTFYVRHGQTIIDAAANVTGQESPIDFRGGKLTVQITANASGNDRIAIYSQAAAAGKISVSGKDVLYGSTVIGRITQTGNGSAAMIVTFNQSVTTEAVNALVKVVTYKSTSTNPPTAQRTISFRLENAANTSSTTDTQLMNISTSKPNRGLTITGGSTAYVNNAAAVVIAPTATITSPTGLDFDGARLTVQITTGSSNRNRMGISNVGGITLVGSDVFYNGDKIGRATLGNNSVSIRLESINATPAAVEALTRAINFSTQGNTSLTNRIATFKLTDVDGSNLTPATQTITLSQST